MKKTIGFTLSWLLYAVGHLASKVMHWPFCGRLYFVYNWLMSCSYEVQDWSGAKGPWKEVDSSPAG